MSGEKTRDWRAWKNDYDISGAFVTDCGGNGNCQFLSISEGLKPVYHISAPTLRRLVAKEFTEMSASEFESVILSYRLEVEENEFQGGWSPKQCDTPAKLAKEVACTNGHHYQGDHTTLAFLAKALNVQFIVFCQNIQWCYRENEAAPTSVFLLYHGNSQHYQLLGCPSVGHASLSASHSNVDTVFHSDLIPLPFATYLNTARRERETIRNAQPSLLPEGRNLSQPAIVQHTHCARPCERQQHVQLQHRHMSAVTRPLQVVVCARRDRTPHHHHPHHHCKCHCHHSIRAVWSHAPPRAMTRVGFVKPFPCGHM